MTAHPIKIPGVPWRFSETAAVASGAAPVLGADTDAILREAGFSTADVAALRADEII